MRKAFTTMVESQQWSLAGLSCSPVTCAIQRNNQPPTHGSIQRNNHPPTHGGGFNMYMQNWISLTYTDSMSTSAQGVENGRNQARQDAEQYIIWCKYLFLCIHTQTHTHTHTHTPTIAIWLRLSGYNTIGLPSVVSAQDIDSQEKWILIFSLELLQQDGWCQDLAPSFIKSGLAYQTWCSICAQMLYSMKKHMQYILNSWQRTQCTLPGKPNLIMPSTQQSTFKDQFGHSHTHTHTHSLPMLTINQIREGMFLQKLPVLTKTMPQRAKVSSVCSHVHLHLSKNWTE